MIQPPKNIWWEKGSPAEIYKRQSALLYTLLNDRVIPFTAYYRALFQKSGLRAKDLRSTDDLIKLPFTSKKDILHPKDFIITPESAQLKKQFSTLIKILKYGPKGAKQYLEDELRPIHMTSTTGRSSEPVPFLYTKHDLANLEASGKRLMNICGTKSNWNIVNAFPFAPHLAFWQAWYAAIGSTTFTFSTGGGKVMGTEGNVSMIQKTQPEAVIAMPTFLYHLLQSAHSKGMQWPNLKALVLGGEKVPEGMRRKLRKLAISLGSNDVDIISTYGFTEAKLAFAECPVPEGTEPSGYHLYPDLAFVEIINPKTGERLPDHTAGEIVFTPLNPRGSVVLRYRTGDIISGGITHEPCPHCNRTCPRLLGSISRVSDIHRLQMDKIKGTLVDLSALEHLLDDTDHLGAWQIELRKHNDDPLEVDEITVHAVAMDTPKEALAASIKKRLSEETELSPNEIVFHDWEAMRSRQGVGKELKEKKILDNRP